MVKRILPYIIGFFGGLFLWFMVMLICEFIGRGIAR